MRTFSLTTHIERVDAPITTATVTFIMYFIYSLLMLLESAKAFSPTSNRAYVSKISHTITSSLQVTGELSDGDSEQADGSLPLRPEQLKSLLDQMSGMKSDTTTDEENNWMKTEQDFKIYADLLREMETTGEEGIYSNILGDLNSSRDDIVIPPADADADSPLVVDEVVVEETVTINDVFDDIDGIGETIANADDGPEIKDIADPYTGTEEMMKRALEEALIEVRKNSPLDPASDPRSILNDKEMMKELNAIFDRANEKLLSSISEIRQEQDALSKATAEGRSSAIETEERRLIEAEESVNRLVRKVRQETDEVEKAVLNLKDAQSKVAADPLSQAAGLKRGGIFKQAAFVGTLLFTFRSLGDLGSMISFSGDFSSHGYAAAVQGLIALICAAYFKFS